LYSVKMSNYKPRPYARDKLLFLEKYLPAFLTATKKALTTYYIDLFAGEGKYDDGSEGSPLIALRARSRGKEMRAFTKCFFVERDSAKKQKLEQAVKELCNQDSSCPEYEIFEGDCNKVIDNILSQINKEAPTFVFADPTGINFHWETLEKISEWRTEIYILFPTNTALIRIIRCAYENAMYEKVVSNFFGTNEWKEIYKEGEKQNLDIKKIIANLLGFYIRRLKEHFNFVLPPRTISKRDDIVKYHMLFVTRHSAGNKIARDIWLDFEQSALRLGWEFEDIYIN